MLYTKVLNYQPLSQTAVTSRSRAQKQKQAKHQGQRTHGESGVIRFAAPSAAASALKGYNLSAGTATEVATSKLPISDPQGTQHKPQVAAVLVHRPSRSGLNPSGNANVKKTQDQWQQDSRPESNPSAPSTSSINAKRESFARKAKRDRTAFEGKL